MKRAILLLATTLLVTGCHSHCDYSDLAVFWHFPNPAGGEFGCADAGVANVRILIDGSDATGGPVGCVLPDAAGHPTQGITLTSFFGGHPYQIEIDGLDAAGNVLYSDQFVYDPDGFCGLQTMDRILTSMASDLNIAYTFNPPANCQTPAPGGYPTTFMWFKLVDQNGQPFASVDFQNDPTAVPCGAGNATILVPNAPYGRYTLVGIEEVELLTSGKSIVWHYNCVPTSFQHAAAGDVFNAPPMSLQAPGGSNSCPQIAHQQ